MATYLVGCLSSKFRHTKDRFLKSTEGKTDLPSLGGRKKFPLLDKVELFFIQ